MSVTLSDKTLSIAVNLAIWLMAAAYMSRPDPGNLFGLLLGLGCAVLGGYVSEPLVDQFIKEGDALSKRLITLVVGAVPLVLVLCYVLILQAIGVGLEL